MGLDVTMVKELVVIPVCKLLQLDAPAAISLVTGTAIKESALQYLKQIGTGPALGLWQIEPATEQDTWNTFLNLIANHTYFAAVETLLSVGPTTPQLVGNLPYSAAICRLKYWRSPLALPAATDATGMANYWKRVYNSNLGAGVVDAATVACFQQAIDA